MIYTNPVYGFVRTLVLFITGRIRLLKKDIGKKIKMQDGKVFTIFRHVEIKRFLNKTKHPEALFLIRFKPVDMSVEENIRFSRLPMMVFMGFKGFRSKYWCVDEKTGLCQGIYEWDTRKDAENYSKSIAVRFMNNRSEKGSVKFEIIKNIKENRTWGILG